MRILSLAVESACIRAALVDVASASVVGPTARVEFDVDRPTPDAAEVPTDRLWSAFTRAAREATRGAEGIEGVGMSGLPSGLVLLDSRDNPLRAVRLPSDRRARAAARQTWAATGTDFLNTVGLRPLPAVCSAVCYRQMLSEEPYLIRDVKGWLHLNGWLGFRLTGQKRFDPAGAGVSGLFNTLTDRQWSAIRLEFFNLDPAWLPKVVDAALTLGTLLPAVAAELGLPPGLPVKLGASDLTSAVLAENLKPGDLFHTVGATQHLATMIDRPAPDPRRQVRLLGIGSSCLHLTCNPIGGVAFDWLHQLCFRDLSRGAFDVMLDTAIERKTRVSLEPPFLGSDEMEIEAHRASFRDLTLSADRLDLAAALVQEMRRQHQRSLVALGAGERFRRIVMTGEGADVVRRLLPVPDSGTIEIVENAALRGVACLFRPTLLDD